MDKYAELLGMEQPCECDERTESADHYKELLGIDDKGRCVTNSGLPWEGYYISAYGIAVKRGFNGTEEEWLESLKGDKGPTGAKLVSQEKVGEDADGNYIYLQTFDDGTTAGFITPKGAKGNSGDPGPQGLPGEDGVSPTVTVTDIPGGHRVTITDADGSHVFDVMDGDGGVKWAEYEATPVTDILAWAAAGQAVGCVYNSRVYSLCRTSANGALFASIESQTSYVIRAYTLAAYDEDVWENESVQLARFSDLSGKQDTISDLADIRAGAAAGSTALQSVPPDYRTAAEQDIIDAGKVDTTDYDPTAKTAAMTQAVGKDASGKLWTTPGGGGSDLFWVTRGTTTHAAIRAAIFDGKLPVMSYSNRFYVCYTVPASATSTTAIYFMSTYGYSATGTIYYQSINSSNSWSGSSVSLEVTSHKSSTITASTTNYPTNTAVINYVAENAYAKPGTGIPKTDLSTEVQDSLDLADSSLQEDDVQEATMLDIDTVVTEDSTHLITSGAVYAVLGDVEAAINAIRGVSA